MGKRKKNREKKKKEEQKASQEKEKIEFYKELAVNAIFLLKSYQYEA